MSQKTPQSQSATASKRLIRGALWPLFALLLLVPKFLALRRHAVVWQILRIIAALAGMALILGAVTHHASGWTAAAGASLLFLALISTPERRKQTLDEKSRELGALIAVHGGQYRSPQHGPVRVHLCVGPDRVWFLDPRLRVVLKLPLTSVAAVQVQPQAQPKEPPGENVWKLSFVLSGPGVPNPSLDLLYQGPFAEHFARVAESTVRSQLRRELPVLP